MKIMIRSEKTILGVFKYYLKSHLPFVFNLIVESSKEKQYFKMNICLSLLSSFT